VLARRISMKTSQRIHDGRPMNPVGKKIEPKSMYCERLDETVV
jgi:hypothetical protein